LGRRGRERARARYAWPVVARQHLDFFEQLLQGRREPSSVPEAETGDVPPKACYSL
jgi:hypothetical protein